MDPSPPGSSVHGILQARRLQWAVISFSGDLPNPGTAPASPLPPALAGGFFTTERPGEPPPRSRAGTSFNTSSCRAGVSAAATGPSRPPWWGLGSRGQDPSCELSGSPGSRQEWPEAGTRCRAAPALPSLPARVLRAHPQRGGGLRATVPGEERTEPDPAPGAELGPSAGIRLPQGPRGVGPALLWTPRLSSHSSWSGKWGARRDAARGPDPGQPLGRSSVPGFELGFTDNYDSTSVAEEGRPAWHNTRRERSPGQVTVTF